MTKYNYTKIKGIIFDYGGTIDTGGDHWSEVIWKAYEKTGISVTKDSFRDAYVYAERELAKTRYILPHHNFRDLLLIKMRIELQYLANVGLIRTDDLEPYAQTTSELCYATAKESVDNSKQVIEELSKHFPLVLVSNFYGNVEAVLSDFDIRKYFQDIVESAVVGIRKPDPEIFMLGVKKLGLKPEETLVIGDSYKKDILPSESIGCKVMWIKGKGWSSKEDAQQHPCIIKSLKEVSTLLGLNRYTRNNNDNAS